MGITPEGTLTPCPASPNCVCSDANDAAHRIAPLTVRLEPQQAWQALIEHLETEPSYTIVERGPEYVRAEARTRWLRFVDDMEFHLRPADGVIAMRSASRIGYSDLGTNRRRLERLRQALDGRL